LRTANRRNLNPLAEGRGSAGCKNRSFCRVRPGLSRGSWEHTRFRQPRRWRCQRGPSRGPGLHGGGQL